MSRIEVLEKEIESLNNELEILNEKLNMVDSYSQHFMTQTISILGVIIAIATVILSTAAYFMIKNMINAKVNNEVENIVLNVLRKSKPIYYANGKGLPNEKNEIILPDDIEGVDELLPDTLMMIETNVKNLTWDQLGSGLLTRLVVNEKGQRVIVIDNYVQNGEEVSWLISWVRKNYQY